MEAVVFRTNFVGVDRDPFSLGAANGFDIVVTHYYWMVLVNLRGSLQRQDSPSGQAGHPSHPLWTTVDL